jgi:nicotinate phosphoribosyltransferase
LVNPHIYRVGLEESLYRLRNDLVFKMKNYDGEENNI